VIKVVVFDFDGVVLDNADVKTEAFVELYAAHGADVTAKVRAHHLANLGISRFKKFEWIAQNVLRTSISDAESKALGERFSELALAKVLASPFVGGARAALDRLAAQMPLMVASGTPQGELDMVVDKRGLSACFREVHGSPAEKPAIIRGIMERHGVGPRELLFIGDGMSDHKAAVTAGVEFLARDTPSVHDEWVALGVRREPDLVKLPEVVAGWR
jgi:phosphoglycolate phosphatase-like HAD superfamily hydrolase